MVNPFAEDEQTVTQLRGAIRLQRAEVTLVPSNDGSNPHVVRVSPRGEGTTVTAQVLTPRTGDVHLPDEGDTVLIAETKSEITVVLGVIYTGDGERPPDYDDDRILSSDGAMTLDGGETTVTLTDDGDVVVGDETTGSATRAITDVDVQTTKDADGHVTSVSLNITRSPNVYLND